MGLGRTVSTTVDETESRQTVTKRDQAHQHQEVFMLLKNS